MRSFLDAPWPDTATDLADVSVPVILICGVDDDEVGSPELLAAQLPNTEVVQVPGDHFTANSKPELHQALVAFLGHVGPSSGSFTMCTCMVAMLSTGFGFTGARSGDA